MRASRSQSAGHTRALLRPWRWAFVVYLLAMTTGTHWPRLRFGAEIPASDKMIHLMAFAGLTFLLWRCRWFMRWPVAAMLVPAWAVLDEFSQGIPRLGRTVSPYDITADLLGVSLAAAFLWATRRVGGARARRGQTLNAYAFDRVFAGAAAWAWLAGILVTGIAVIAVAWPLTEPAATAAVIRGTAAAMAVVGLATTLILWKRGIRIVETERPCFACGTPGGDRMLGGRTDGVCRACDAPLHAAQWTRPPPAPITVRSVVRPLGKLVGAVALVALLFGVAAQAVAIFLDTDPAPGVTARVTRLLAATPPPLSRAIAIGGLMIAGLLFTGWHREERSSGER